MWELLLGVLVAGSGTLSQSEQAPLWDGLAVTSGATFAPVRKESKHPPTAVKGGASQDGTDAKVRKHAGDLDAAALDDFGSLAGSLADVAKAGAGDQVDGTAHPEAEHVAVTASGCPSESGGAAAVEELLGYIVGIYVGDGPVKTRAADLLAALQQGVPLAASLGTDCAGHGLAEILLGAAEHTTSRLVIGKWPDVSPLPEELRAAAARLEAAPIAAALAPTLAMLADGHACTRRPLAAHESSSSEAEDSSAEAEDSSDETEDSLATALQDRASPASLLDTGSALSTTGGQMELELERTYAGGVFDGCGGRDKGGSERQEEVRKKYECFQFEMAQNVVKRRKQEAKADGWVKFYIDCKRESYCYKRQRGKWECPTEAGCRQHIKRVKSDMKRLLASGGGYDPEAIKQGGELIAAGYSPCGTSKRDPHEKKYCKCSGKFSDVLSY